MSNKVTWLTYEFDVNQHSANWSAVGGVYIFCYITPQNQWRALYVGQAESLAERIPTHERWQEAVRLGATHVHARAVQAAATRDAIEQELIQAYQPQLNVQLR
jgi:excinuclease UvrABC nuclease subunit